MIEITERYAVDTIKNAKALAAALDRFGFDVQAKEFGYIESHQVAVNVLDFGGGERVSENKEKRQILKLALPFLLMAPRMPLFSCVVIRRSSLKPAGEDARTFERPRRW